MSSWWLAAERIMTPDEFARGARGWGQDSPLALGGVIILTMLVLTGCGVIIWHYRKQYVLPALERRRRAERVLAHMFDAHAMNRHERDLVLRATDALGLTNPLLLFVKRSLWPSAREKRPGDAPGLSELERKLF